MEFDRDPTVPTVCTLGRPIREKLGIEAQLPIAMQILLLRLAAREASPPLTRRSAPPAPELEPYQARKSCVR